ncbi:uncharacterized protein LOC129580342 [Sitodiplosis mosellana]|uniref:uncharacterized protein LOC129580342 n=1 Tax=Sitodiplosis mosellana TaxID=263140 RepID=UPI0024437E30|nr:uncharacterized protein LOC129580342 [Sitodiplosis mosellana]
MFKKTILISLIALSLTLHVANGAAVQVQSAADPQPRSFDGRVNSISPSYSAGSSTGQNSAAVNQRNGFDSQALPPFSPGSRLPSSNVGFYPSYYTSQASYGQPQPAPMYQPSMLNPSAYGGFGNIGYAPNAISSYAHPAYYNQPAYVQPVYDPRSIANTYANNMPSQAYQAQQLQQQPHFPFYRGGIGQRLKSEEPKKPSQ